MLSKGQFERVEMNKVPNWYLKHVTNQFNKFSDDDVNCVTKELERRGLGKAVTLTKPPKRKKADTQRPWSN